jgi:Na+/H+ antiporter NhaD/arsenite permease-like protein
LTQAHVFTAAFLLAYCYIAFGSKLRGAAVWAVAAAAVAVCAISGLGVDPGALARSVDINILLIFAGILLIAEVLMETGAPAWLAARLVAVSGSLGVASLLLCLLSGVVSMFVENVATVMLIAPIALELCRRMEASPVPLLICIAISSNLQGTATLVGDPPSMILASAMGLSFNDFFVHMGRPGIFFAVQAGALASTLVLWRIFRRDRRRISWDVHPSVTSWVPAGILAGVIAALVASSFLGPDAGMLSGVVCAIGGSLALLWHSLSHRGLLPTILRIRPRDHLEERRGSKEIVRGFDFDTLALLAGIFFMVGALEHYGVMGSVGSFIAGISGNNPFVAFLLIVWGSVAISAFVDNVPYVTAMIPVANAVSGSLGLAGNPVLVFGLLIGACIGGNISPVGASANIIAVSMLRKAGFRVGFGGFVRIGLPFTILATLAGSIFLWGVWAP